MAFAARYPGICGRCGQAFGEGASIEKNGSKYQHATCSAASARTAKPSKARCVTVPPAGTPPTKPRKSNYPTSAPEAGAHQVSGIRTGRDDQRYVVGDVLHLVKVSTPGGGPDGHYYVVLAHRLVRPNEDMGSYDWMEHAWVRAATTEEAETKAASIRRASAPKTVAEYVIRTLKAGERLPEESAHTAIPRDVGYIWTAKDASIEQVAIVGESVVGYHGGYYDDYRPSAWRCMATETLVLAVQALASGDADLLAVAADAVMGLHG